MKDISQRRYHVGQYWTGRWRGKSGGKEGEKDGGRECQCTAAKTWSRCACGVHVPWTMRDWQGSNYMTIPVQCVMMGDFTARWSFSNWSSPVSLYDCGAMFVNLQSLPSWNTHDAYKESKTVVGAAQLSVLCVAQSGVISCVSSEGSR
jgi:hypothetical protein